MSRARLRIALATPPDEVRDFPLPGGGTCPVTIGHVPSWASMEITVDGKPLHGVTRVRFEAHAGLEHPKVILECIPDEIDFEVPIAVLDEAIRQENVTLRKALKAIEDHETKRDPQSPALRIARDVRLKDESR